MLVVTTAIVLATAHPAEAVEAYAVASTADSPDESPGDGTCADALGQCTLRAAIDESNANVGAATITVPNGVYSTSSSLVISDVTDIRGTSTASTIIDGASGSVFWIDDDGVGKQIRVSLTRLTIRGGIAEQGGGIHNSGAAVLVQETRVTGNVAMESGAGIANKNRSIMSVIRSTIDSNGDGDLGSTARVGGIDNSDGAILYLVQSTVANNEGNRFGGIRNLGYLSARNSTISGNVGRLETGGILNTGTAYLNNVTVTGNHAAVEDAFLADVTTGGIRNSGGYIALANTVVAGNTNALATSAFECIGELTSASYNIVGKNLFGLGERNPCTVVGPAVGNQLDVDAADLHFGGLASNGGPTQTHALGAGSIAINTGNPVVPNGVGAACESTDQRTAQRGVAPAGRCDVGAYERGGGPGDKATPPRPPGG